MLFGAGSVTPRCVIRCCLVTRIGSAWKWWCASAPRWRRPRRALHRLHSRARRWPGALLVAVGGPVARRLFRLRVEGDEHLPATSPAIIAANHLSFFDHVALVLCVGRPLSFVGKADYLDSWKTRFVLPALGM